jgi:hypothetical protein
MPLRPRTAAAATLAALLCSTALAQAPAGEAPVTFDREVKPILRKRCGNCHNAERPRGELDLSTMAGVNAGGAGGKVVAAGRPEESPLYALAAHLETPTMPPNAPKIPQRELDLIRRWVEGGLVESPADVKAGAVGARTASEADAKPTATGGLMPALALPRPTPVAALAVSPASPMAAVGGSRQIFLFNLASRALAGAVPFPEGDVLALRFSRDGRRLLAAGGVGAESGQAAVYQTAGWARESTIGDETDEVLAVDLSPDGKSVVLGGPPRVVKVFSNPSGRPLHALRKATDWVTAASFSPDGLLIAAGDRFGGLFLWEARTGKEFIALRGHAKAVTSLGWAAGGDRLVSAGDDGTVRTWDLHEGRAAAQWEAHQGGVLGLDVQPSGRLVTGGRDRRVKVWEPDGRAVSEFGPAADEVTRVAWTADGRAVAYGDAAGEVGLWPLSDPSPSRLPMPVATARRAPALVAPTLAPARRPAPRPAPAAAVAVAANPSAATDDIEAALAAAREAERAAERAVERLSQLSGRKGGTGGRAEARRAAVAALQSLRSALAADPGNEALARALEETKKAVEALERAPGRADNAQGSPKAGSQ